MSIPKTEVVIMAEGVEYGRHVLEPGEYIIGRTRDCPIRLDLGLVSRAHARLTINYDFALIEDLGSANGTLVNGKPITEITRLWPNQKIEIASATIELHRIKTLAGTDDTLSPQTAALRLLLPKEFLHERKYEVGEQIAQGGMGAILSAKETTIRREVAMKVMLFTGAQEELARFVEEAQITGQLEHPNIVPVHELGVDENDQVFYTMKMVRGITLQKVFELLAKGVGGTVGKYPLAVLLTIFQKVCDAVAFAHAKGVIHRDLKPANIMIGSYGEVLVMDWGLAKIIAKPTAQASTDGQRSVVLSLQRDTGGGMRTLAGSILGTPQYMAPEQAAGDLDSLDARTDIYALGTILYQILALRTTVSAGDVGEMLEKITSGALTPPAAFNKDAANGAFKLPHLPGGRVPESLSAVAMKALALKQADRYQRVEELQHEITQFQTGFATVAEHAGLARRALLFLKRNRKVSLAAAAVLLLCGVAVGFVEYGRYQAKVAEHTRLMSDAENAAKQGNWDGAVTATTKANAILDLDESRKSLQRFLVDGARSDLASQYWAAAAIKLQEALRLDPEYEAAQKLMPLALGEGFATVETKFPAELVELASSPDLQLSSAGARRLGPLPVKELRLRAGIHYFEVYRDGRRWCSLPVEVARGAHVQASIPVSDIPPGYEYIHEGEFMQGDDGTVQADGFIGQRRRTVGGFFMKSAPVLNGEYAGFLASPDHERLLREELAAEKLTVADIFTGADAGAEFKPFRANSDAGARIPVRGLCYYEAAAYARWAQARLPTEEEWEKAARGIDGRIFSGGNRPPPEDSRWKSDVGMKECLLSPFGCLGLTDTAWQWMASRLEPATDRRVVKGGASPGALLDRKPSRRKGLDPRARYYAVGFIVCKDLGGTPTGAK